MNMLRHSTRSAPLRNASGTFAFLLALTFPSWRLLADQSGALHQGQRSGIELPPGVRFDDWAKTNLDEALRLFDQSQKVLDHGLFDPNLSPSRQDVSKALLLLSRTGETSALPLRRQLAQFEKEDANLLELHHALSEKDVPTYLLLTWARTGASYRRDGPAMNGLFVAIGKYVQERLSTRRCKNVPWRILRATVQASRSVETQENAELKRALKTCQALRATSNVLHGHPDGPAAFEDVARAGRAALMSIKNTQSAQERKETQHRLFVLAGIAQRFQTPEGRKLHHELLGAGSKSITTQAVESWDKALKSANNRKQGLSSQERKGLETSARALHSYQRALGISKPTRKENALEELSNAAAKARTRGQYLQAAGHLRKLLNLRRQKFPDQRREIYNDQVLLYEDLKMGGQYGKSLEVLDQGIADLRTWRTEGVVFPYNGASTRGLLALKSDLLFELGRIEESRMAWVEAKKYPTMAEEAQYAKRAAMAGLAPSLGNSIAWAMSAQDRSRDLRLASPSEALSLLEKMDSHSVYELVYMAHLQADRDQWAAAVTTLRRASAAALEGLTEASKLGAVLNLSDAALMNLAMVRQKALSLLARAPSESGFSELAFFLDGQVKGRAFDGLGEIVTSSGYATPSNLSIARTKRSTLAADFLKTLGKRLTTAGGQPSELAFIGGDDKGIEVFEQKLFHSTSFERAAKRGTFNPFKLHKSSELSLNTAPYLGKIRASVGPDSLLLAYVTFEEFIPGNPFAQAKTGEDRYGLFYLSEANFGFVDLGSAAPIDLQVSELRNLLATPPQSKGAEASESLRQRSQRLAQRLLPAALQDTLAKVRRLQLVPEGMLRFLPFAALHDGAGWLVDRHVLEQKDGARELMPTTATSPTPVGGGTIFAAPQKPAATYDHPNLQPGRFPQLLGSKVEGETLAQLLPGARLITGESFHEQALLSVSSPLFLHIAAHGAQLVPGIAVSSTNTRGSTFVPKGKGATPVSKTGPAPLRGNEPWLTTALVTSPPPKDAAKPEDSFVTAFEIARMNLRGTELVFLTACDTGTGVNHPIHGTHSLAQAFSVAGARSVIGTLWSIEDASAVELSSDFYALLNQGKARGEALQMAQLREKARRPHPFFWASTLLWGEAGVIPHWPHSAAAAEPIPKSEAE